MKIDTYVNNLKLLINNEVVVSKNQKTTIKLTDYSLEITFLINDTTLDKGKFLINQKSEKNSLAFTLSNFDDALMTGMQNPFKIGKLENKQLFLSFYVTQVINQLSSISFILVYALYLQDNQE